VFWKKGCLLWQLALAKSAVFEKGKPRGSVMPIAAQLCAFEEGETSRRDQQRRFFSLPFYSA
jgi:hypothetical protein